jgi:hypothetical protein
MSDNPTPTPSLAEIETRLREVARLLQTAPDLDPEARRTLATLIEELGTSLRSATVSPDEAAHLAGTAAHLADALHQQDEDRVGQARGGLQQAVLAVEARAPFAAGLAHRLLEALATIGI